MSGVIKGIGKVFKATVIKPIKFVLKQDHKVAMKIWHTPILRYAAIAVAAYFTAGAALGWFSGAAAAGGTAAAGTVAASGAAAGGSFFAGTAAGAAVSTGGAALAGSATATTLATVSVTAVGGAAATGATVAGAVAAASVGAAAGSIAANQAGSNASNAMDNGNGSVNAVTDNGLSTTKGGMDITNLSETKALAPTPEALAPASTITADDIAVGLTPGVTEGFAKPTIQQATDTQSVADNTEQKPNLIQRGVQKVKDFFTTPNVDANGVETGTRSLSGTTKLMLLQSGLQVASAVLQKPVRPLQYAGVNARGNGPGLNIHTVNGGFGLATGGQGEPAPGGIPDALLPPGSAGAYSGQGLSNAALTNQTAGQQQVGNLGQAAANNAGVGGLIPQGAVNYMGNRG